MSGGPIVSVSPLGFPWATVDPFLFCVFHNDRYPRSDGDLAPAASLAGRNLGQDFSGKDGWSMYHGLKVPGFPAHPHRGFETVTIVRQGLVDHADSLGAAARYGRGDVQWLTTGNGVVHSEMFPLLESQADNPLQLFQVWLNLPARSKLAPPHFTMFWAESLPRTVLRDEAGRRTEIVVVAGRYQGPGVDVQSLPPPPDSWAARPEADLAIWTLRLEPNALVRIPAATGGAATVRRLYFFAGEDLTVDEWRVARHSVIEVAADRPVAVVNGAQESELLMLQGRPIGEPVVQHGPFVMNSAAEIEQTFAAFRRTQFGKWTWPDTAPVHGGDNARFARYPNGRLERPPIA